MFWAYVLIIRRSKLHYTATYRCDDTRGCIMQFWPPDDEHMCSKHEEAWNKLIVKQKICASSWLITEINGTRMLQGMIFFKTGSIMKWHKIKFTSVSNFTLLMCRTNPIALQHPPSLHPQPLLPNFCPLKFPGSSWCVCCSLPSYRPLLWWYKSIPKLLFSLTCAH